MKIIAIAFLSLASSLAMAQTNPGKTPIFGKSPVKASIYKITFKEDGDGFFKGVRENLCTLRFDADVFDTRNMENVVLDSQGQACTVMIDGKPVIVILNTLIQVDNTPIHNDGLKQDSKTYSGSLALLNQDATPADLPKVPYAFMGVYDIHNNKPIIVHMGAETTVKCAGENNSQKIQKPSVRSAKNGHCEIVNPVRIEANVEFETP